MIDMKDYSKLSKKELIIELIFLNTCYAVAVDSNKKLQEQLSLGDVEGLKSFREWWNNDNDGVCTTITHKDIERYFKNKLTN